MLSPLTIFLLLGQDPAAQDRDLREKVEALERKVQELERRQADTVSANPLNVLNPTITVFGNLLWRLDDREIVTEEGDEIDDTVNLREVELDFRAAIDPYADGVVIVALESEVPGEFEAAVEELLVNVKSLPVGFWESPPLGTKITLGRMRTEFGRNNRLHLHDLPQLNRPAAVEQFLGEEGHAATGASAQMFLPSPGDTALELTLQGFQGGNLPLAEEKSRPAWLANLRFFLPLTDEHSFDVALIGFYGHNDPDGRRQSRAASLDWLYRWKPLRAGQSRSFLLGGQFFYARHEFEVDTDGDDVPDAGEATSPFGYYVWAQLQISRSLYVGVRWDRTDVLRDEDAYLRRVQPYVSWYLSEFFRLRVAYEHTWSDLEEEDGLDSVLFEANVVFGSHPPEPFWVNK
jgi:hypothetical protein